jgi:EmrB/QacA subfamily drug resistance transporter
MKTMQKNTGVLILLFFGVLMGALDISIVGPAIPSIEKTIQVETKDLSWVFNIYILFNLAGISLFARLSDRFGRRVIYILAVSVFAFGSLVVAMADNYSLLIIGRGIQGFGSSGIFPVALATIGDIFPVEKRGRALGLIGAVFGIAFLAGPFIAGTLLHYYTWNALFLINIPFALLIILLSLTLLPSKTHGKDIRIDYAGIILMAAALALYTIALTNLDTARLADSILSAKVLPLLVFAAILTVILFLVEKAEKFPVLEVKFFRSREIRFAGIIAVGLGLFQSVILFLPTLAVTQFGVSPSQASFMLIALVAMTAIGSPMNGRLVDLAGSRIIIVAGLAIAAAGLFLFSRLPSDTTGFYLACGLLGFGLSMRGALNYIMLNETGEMQRASAQGMLLIFISVGQLTGASLISILAASSGNLLTGFSNAFLLFAGIAAGLFILAIFLKSRKRELESHTSKEIETNINTEP